MKRKLSIIVPVYNEAKTVCKVVRDLDRINLGWGKELVLVDDGSTDGSTKKLKEIYKTKLNNKNFKFIFHKTNKGKGAAVKSALSKATGNYVVIFDSDGECDVRDLHNLLGEVEVDEHSVVFGNRYPSNSKNNIKYLHFYWGEKLLALLINVLFSQCISDPEAGMKLIKRDKINFDLTEKGFGQEIEWTSKLAKQGIKIKEVPIRYYPRSFQEGKKISYLDGIRAIYLIFKYRFF